MKVPNEKEMFLTLLEDSVFDKPSPIIQQKI